MPTPTELFEQLDWNMVEEFVKQRQEEHLHLDFKTVNNSEMSNKDDKRNFAKAVSGFGNSDGGIIVWGVDARKNPDGVDCATEIVELKNPALMVTRLNAITGEATTPIVDGVRHRPIANKASGGGVVASLIPENDSGPFMAKLGENRYYKRSGDSFYVMEHYDLDDMFGRRQKPRLELQVERGTDGDRETLTFRLLNTGRAIARHAGFVIRISNIQDMEIVGINLENVSGLNQGRHVLQYNDDTTVVHPNGIRVNLGGIKFRRVEATAPVELHATVYCADARTHELRYRLDP